MTTYFVRRVLQTTLFIFLSWLAVYTVLVYLMPNGPKEQYDRVYQRINDPANATARPTANPNIIGPGAGRVDETPDEIILDSLDRSYGIGKLWPVSFMAWLFDPSDTIRYDENNNPVPFGVSYDIGGWHITGSGILSGDLGITNVTSRNTFNQGHVETVTSVLAGKWNNTLLLVGLSFIVALLIAIPTGIIAAIRRNSPLDHVLTFV
jgi:hypothetical protein